MHIVADFYNITVQLHHAPFLFLMWFSSFCLTKVTLPGAGVCDLTSVESCLLFHFTDILISNDIRDLCVCE